MVTLIWSENLEVISECTSYLEFLSTYCLLVIAYSRFKIHIDLTFSGLFTFSWLGNSLVHWYSYFCSCDCWVNFSFLTGQPHSIPRGTFSKQDSFNVMFCSRVVSIFILQRHYFHSSLISSQIHAALKSYCSKYSWSLLDSSVKGIIMFFSPSQWSAKTCLYWTQC